MNLPKTKRRPRFDKDQWRREFNRGSVKGSGHFSMALEGPEYYKEFTLLVTEFTHLEYRMEYILAILMESDREVASHVMRSIINAKAKRDLMTALLSRARHNADKPEDFDEIIDDFNAVSKIRNDLVHARWQTDIANGDVYVIFPNKDPMILDQSAYAEFDISIMTSARDRIHELNMKIFQLLGRHYK
jgi:hypothetical protein